MKKTIYFSFYVKLTIYLVSSFLLTTEASAQAVKTTIDTTWLKKRIPEMMDSAAVTGLSVAVVQQGKFVWHKGFGRSNNQTRQPVTAATLYEAASLSKVVFSYIVWQLVDQGVLTLDKPLVDYVPLSHIEEVFVNGKVTDARFH
ncbi:MAG: serine hydrolase domain-containing protein, partial [Thermonemataceae bacterium]